MKRLKQRDIPKTESQISIDNISRKVISPKGEFILPRKEFELLNLLISQPEKVFTREEIFEHIWGGEVVVEIEVRCNGRVSSARVLSGGDDYMREVALRAARSSTVNIDNNAPDRQKGTITYIFVPQ